MIRVSLAAFAALFLAATGYAARPNVVFVITDDQGYGDLSCHGNPILKTPHLDALHAESTRLVDYHVSPTCSPTRGALMSGHVSNRCGVWHTIMGRSLLFEGETTLGEAFTAGGYATGMFGKWHLGDNYPFRPEDRGFGHVVRHGGGGVGQTPDVWNNAYFDDSYFVNGQVEPRKGFCTDVFFAEAKKFIKATADAGRPFFAYISTNAPHSPFHCPEKYSAPYADRVDAKQAIFFGMIANIDENIGALRDWLEAEGIADNTLFVFTTDNGAATGRSIWNAGMSGGKGSSMDGGHRVPMFLHWPAGGMDKPVDVGHVTAHVDMLPTFQALCGLPVDPDYPLDGKSLVPLLKNPQAEWEDRVLITDSQRVLNPIEWKSSSVMTDRWRLVDGKQLFDIRADPGQKTDLASQRPEVFEKLRAEYGAWWESLQPALKRRARIVLGHAAENPAKLTCHDWLTSGGYCPWNQKLVRNAPDRIGTWSVMVDQPGAYRITLRRWPAEAAAPLTAGLPSEPGVPGLAAFREASGRPLPIAKAGFEIGDVAAEKLVDPGAEAVVFEAELSEGPASLLAYFVLEDGKRIGAFYAEVERLSE